MACLPLPILKYKSLEKESLMGKFASLNTTRRNISTTFQIPKTYSHNITNKWDVKLSSQHYSRRLSALADDQKNVENLLYKQERSDGNAAQAGLLKAVDTFLLFARPYAVFGVIIGIISTSLLPVEAIGDLSPQFFWGLLKAVVAGSLMQIFVSGINHLFDVEIDKINKEHLPLPTGDYPTNIAWATVCIVTLLSLGIGYMSQSPALLCGVFMQFIFGAIYSVDFPFLRWKRIPLLAITSMMLIHSFSIYIPYFIHAQRYLLGRSIVITKPMLLTTFIMALHTIALTIFKDIPDTEGDKNNGIETFSTEHGREKAFLVGIGVLLVEYGIAAVMGASSASTLFNKFITVAGHCVLALTLLFRSSSVDVMNKSTAFSFYLFIWKLFYVGNVLVLFYR